jgi:hypothetical protein
MWASDTPFVIWYFTCLIGVSQMRILDIVLVAVATVIVAYAVAIILALLTARMLPTAAIERKLGPRGPGALGCSLFLICVLGEGIMLLTIIQLIIPVRWVRSGIDFGLAAIWFVTVFVSLILLSAGAQADDERSDA